jgi:hypothetical protein
VGRHVLHHVVRLKKIHFTLYYRPAMCFF